MPSFSQATYRYILAGADAGHISSETMHIPFDSFTYGHMPVRLQRAIQYAAPTGTGAHISKLWSFPTNDSNAVFVQYTASSDVGSPAQLPDAEHLALLEMRGDRIFKMRNFSTGSLSTFEASVVTCATAFSRASRQD